MRRFMFLAVSGLMTAASPALADTASSLAGSVGNLKTGAEVYQHVCQGCHMPDGKGAMGAGAGFPAFAGNEKLQSPEFAVYTILNGHGGMPWFSGLLTDSQVADVVNYIRSHFGNHFSGEVKPADVAPMSPHLTMEDG
ncbi:cytochrome c [Acetobacter sp. AN02]|uniref:c-type cytochrome n=1 Tax=Acetobacter sp. AN02 TaxID=2894186 RepID=UPI00243426FA|nr:cytochrome c [Acetobacter sp. AN02]MDG6094736.1 cytochrome c [Acetobacter sp. AN02]